MKHVEVKCALDRCGYVECIPIKGPWTGKYVLRGAWCCGGPQELRVIDIPDDLPELPWETEWLDAARATAGGERDG